MAAEAAMVTQAMNARHQVNARHRRQVNARRHRQVMEVGIAAIVEIVSLIGKLF